MSSVDEVDLPVLMSMVKDKLENPDRAWFLEVKLSAREWEKLVNCYYNNKKQGAVEELERLLSRAKNKGKEKWVCIVIEKRLKELKENGGVKNK
jgi:hypothetical protein